MANWAMLGNTIGQGFNQGFTRGVDSRLEEEQKKRYQNWLWEQQEKQRKKLQEEYARQTSEIFGPSGTFNSNAVSNALWGDNKQQPFSFDNLPTKLSMGDLQEPQQAPNQSFKLFGDKSTNATQAQNGTPINSSLGSLSFGANNTFNYQPPVSTSNPTAMRNAITKAAINGNYLAAQALNNFAQNNLLPNWTQQTWIDENGNTYSQQVDQFGNRGGVLQTGKAQLGTRDYITADGRKWRTYVNSNGQDVGESWLVGLSDLELLNEKARLSGSGNESFKPPVTINKYGVRGSWMDDGYGNTVFVPTQEEYDFIHKMMAEQFKGMTITPEQMEWVNTNFRLTGNPSVTHYARFVTPPELLTDGFFSRESTVNAENDRRLLEWDNNVLGAMKYGFEPPLAWIKERSHLYFNPDGTLIQKGELVTEEQLRELAKTGNNIFDELGR